MQPPSSRSGAYPVTVHGTSAQGNEFITTEAGKVECKESLHAEAEEAVATLFLVPTFSECSAFGFISGTATVTANGCRYSLEEPELLAEDEYRSDFGFACEAGKAINVAVSTCEFEIPGQLELASARLTDDTSATPVKDLTFKPEVTGIAYKVLKDNIGCPFAGTGSKTGATFTATSATTLTGQSPSSPEVKIGIEVGEPSSAEGLFKAGAYPATVHGTSAVGNGAITTEAGTVECNESLHAEIGKAATTLALAPTYSSCRAFGFLSATVSPNGCRYSLEEPERLAEDEYRSDFGFACEAGKAINVAVSTCEFEIPGQLELASARLTDDTSATPVKDLTFKPEVTKIAYKVLKDGLGCPFTGTGSKTGATFTATSATTLTGQSPSNPEVKIGIEVGEPPPPPAVPFSAATYPATIHGTSALGNEFITTEAGKVECKESPHTEIGEARGSLFLAPNFSECRAFGFLSSGTTVTANGCRYSLEEPELLAEDEYRSNFGFACEAGQAIKVAASTCEIEIPGQVGLASAHLTDDTAATPVKDLTFKPEVTKIAYKVLKDGLGCPFSGTGSKTGATFTATSATTLTGQSPSSPEVKIGIEVR